MSITSKSIGFHPSIIRASSFLQVLFSRKYATKEYNNLIFFFFFLVQHRLSKRLFINKKRKKENKNVIKEHVALNWYFIYIYIFIYMCICGMCVKRFRGRGKIRMGIVMRVGIFCDLLLLWGWFFFLHYINESIIYIIQLICL